MGGLAPMQQAWLFVCLFVRVPRPSELVALERISSVRCRVPSLVRTTFEQPSGIIQRSGN